VTPPIQPPADAPPPRQQWPEPAPPSPAGEILTQIVLATFQLNARLMDAAQQLATAGGITASWWQVLGGIVDQPHTLADIGRRMGMSRQGVRRVADLLVEHGLAEYRPNPAHRRANLLACTESGYWAIRQIAVEQHPWSDRIGSQLDLNDLHSTLAAMHRLISVLEDDHDPLMSCTVS
jgi:DNA-binding MarR family transcriptional regulator